jgi:hypothetical protein
MKELKRQMFAVITPKSDTSGSRICGSLIRNTRIECLDAHEKMFGGSWCRWKEMGYRIVKVTVRRKP